MSKYCEKVKYCVHLGSTSATYLVCCVGTNILFYVQMMLLGPIHVELVNREAHPFIFYKAYFHV